MFRRLATKVKCDDKLFNDQSLTGFYNRPSYMNKDIPNLFNEKPNGYWIHIFKYGSFSHG